MAGMIVISDLDGTISDAEHRVHLVREHPKDYDAFFAEARNDGPIRSVIMVLNALKQAGHEIHIITGRSEVVRAETLDWLEQHSVPHDRLLMRPEHDYTPDDRLKEQWFLKDYTAGDVLLVLEDRTRVVRMWRRHGLTCLQVAEGDF